MKYMSRDCLRVRRTGMRVSPGVWLGWKTKKAQNEFLRAHQLLERISEIVSINSDDNDYIFPG